MLGGKPALVELMSSTPLGTACTAALSIPCEQHISRYDSNVMSEKMFGLNRGPKCEKTFVCSAHQAVMRTVMLVVPYRVRYRGRILTRPGLSSTAWGSAPLRNLFTDARALSPRIPSCILSLFTPDTQRCRFSSHLSSIFQLLHNCSRCFLPSTRQLD